MLRFHFKNSGDPERFILVIYPYRLYLINIAGMEFLKRIPKNNYCTMILMVPSLRFPSGPLAMMFSSQIR